MIVQKLIHASQLSSRQVRIGILPAALAVSIAVNVSIAVPILVHSVSIPINTPPAFTLVFLVHKEGRILGELITDLRMLVQEQFERRMAVQIILVIHEGGVRPQVRLDVLVIVQKPIHASELSTCQVGIRILPIALSLSRRRGLSCRLLRSGVHRREGQRKGRAAYEARPTQDFRQRSHNEITSQVTEPPALEKHLLVRSPKNFHGAPPGSSCRGSLISIKFLAGI